MKYVLAETLFSYVNVQDMRKINSENKICIYLDQFVISNIVDETTDTWKKVKMQLEKGFVQGVLYCPVSGEHFMETAKKRFENALIHHNYFLSLSENYFFKDDPFLTTQLISSLIRGNKHTLNTFLEKQQFKKFEDIYADINSKNEIFDESITYKLSGQNDLRKVLNTNMKQPLESQFMGFITAMEVQNFIKTLEQYLRDGQMRIRADDYGKHSFPYWIDQLLYILTTKHKFREPQFKILLAELKKNGFSRIPTLNIKFSLGAYLAIKNKQENTGDHIDLMRICIGLISSDIFFTDKKRKSEIDALGLDTFYNTRVFSGTEPDLQEFLTLLETVQVKA